MSVFKGIIAGAIVGTCVAGAIMSVSRTDVLQGRAMPDGDLLQNNGNAVGVIDLYGMPRPPTGSESQGSEKRTAGASSDTGGAKSITNDNIRAGQARAADIIGELANNLESASSAAERLEVVTDASKEMNSLIDDVVRYSVEDEPLPSTNAPQATEQGGSPRANGMNNNQFDNPVSDFESLAPSAGTAGQGQKGATSNPRGSAEPAPAPSPQSGNQDGTSFGRSTGNSAQPQAAPSPVAPSTMQETDEGWFTSGWGSFFRSWFGGN